MEKRQKMENQKVGYTTKDWMLRFVKGMFIGSGFILPGVSGGALAAVFGMYERLISFFSPPYKKFQRKCFVFSTCWSRRSDRHLSTFFFSQFFIRCV